MRGSWCEAGVHALATELEAVRGTYFSRSQSKPGLPARPASIQRLYQRQQVVGLPKRGGTSAQRASIWRTHRIPSTIRLRSTGFPPRGLWASIAAAMVRHS